MAGLYPRNIEQKLGFDTVRELLKEMCESVMGKQEVESMTYSSDHTEVRRWLNETFEMKKVIESGVDRPEFALNDLSAWLPGLMVNGSYGSVEEMLSLLRSLNSFVEVRRFFTKREGNDDTNAYLFPWLADLFVQIEEFPELSRAIDRVIDRGGFVKDSASPELSEIRSELRGMNGSISRAIQRIFSKAVSSGIAEKDMGPTFRNGRMVIPVPAGHKREIPGIIHDESASGRTVFIEPSETVELGNRYRALQLDEQREVTKILVGLADEARPHIPAILDSNTLLGHLDFITAKARFAIEIGGEMPSLARNPEIDWYGAFHPILLLSLRKQGKEIVKLNLRLEGKARILLISGPNAGGKSVALKTAGVVQYMTQCGLLPTLYSNSHMGIFNKIFIDIGDEQSLENDLSTYSSHLRNMRYFLLHADKRTIILIDEIGSGTEPNIGSSLAQAILTKLGETRCYGIVTTHYHNLKRFAEENAGFVNGAMLYDRGKLQPTFQLSIGNAGSSFALEIAGKIGLPRDVIDMAKEIVGTDYVESDRYLMEIARDRKYWQSKRASIKEREARLNQLSERYESSLAEIKKMRRDILQNAKEEAKEILSGANRTIEHTISEIRKVEAEREHTKKIRSQLEEFKKELDQEIKEDIKLPSRATAPKQKKQKKRHAETSEVTKAEIKKELEVGDSVKMVGSTAIGQILSISGKEAEVAFGQLRTKVKLDRLTAATHRPDQSLTSGYVMLNAGTSDSSRRRMLEFRDEIDIRGMRANDALDRVIHFVDDALQFSVKRIRILHGTGGGILREVVRQQLSAMDGIDSYHDEDVRLGGAGITVVNLR